MSDEVGGGRIAPHSVEHTMLLALGEALGIPLAPRSLTLDNGLRLEVEGADADTAATRVLVQLVPNQGPAKSAHRNKAIADMFKLAWLKRTRYPEARIIVCVSETIARFFSEQSWPRAAAIDEGVEVWVARTDGSVAMLIG